MTQAMAFNPTVTISWKSVLAPKRSNHSNPAVVPFYNQNVRNFAMLDRLNVYLNNRPKTKITSKPLTNDTSIKRVDVFPRVRHWRYGTQSNIRGARHSGKSHTCTLYVSGLDAFPSTPCCSTTQSATQVACRQTHAPAANSDQTVTVLR